MESKHIDKLIVKFLENTISASESEELAVWLQTKENQHYFNEFISLHNLINSKRDFDYHASLSKTMNKTSGNRFLTRKLFYYGAAAASIVLIAYLSVVNYNQNNLNTNALPVGHQEIVSGSDKAVLTLDDGKQIILEKGKNYSTVQVTANGQSIKYNTKNADNIKISYNYLTIPKGGQFELTLADGTEVWLNSDTKLRFPTGFKKGENRMVELIYGEAYFEVTPAAKNHNAKFMVHNQNQNIEVLGTAFNVKAYRDENIISTTLVHGKVSITSNNRSKILLPNQQSSLNLATKEIAVKKVDVFYETSWKSGTFSFEGKTLKEIMMVLSRWYDFEVVFKSKQAEKEEFVGVIGKNEKIEVILKEIKDFGIIKKYEIKGKTIIIE